uniref:Uncharacterized protein n=1 Tax=Trieres chinensis TaxID=1514140 RepID=A0A7S1YZW1_TRICV
MPRNRREFEKLLVQLLLASLNTAVALRVFRPPHHVRAPGIRKSFAPARSCGMIRRDLPGNIFSAHLSTKSMSRSVVAGPEESEARPCVLQRVDLSDRFGRWRFLQRLLDAEVDAGDVNEILYRVLKSFIDFPRPERIPDDTFPGGSRENPSPQVTPEHREIMESIFSVDEVTNVGIIPALQEPDCTPFEVSAYNGLVRLLPDPIEDEDAHKGGWDLVMELIGREAVKIAEQSRDKGWRVRCDIARLLVQYDFLTDGIVEEPFE